MRKWLKEMRINAGLSQKEIAKQLSVVQSYYCKIENGIKQPDMAYSMMEKIAHAMLPPNVEAYRR